MEGIGVEQDDNKGYYWFLKAADLGNTTSIASVGMCYELGKGVELSYHEALKWYQKALDNGYQMDDWITERINSCEANLNGPKANYEGRRF